MFTHPFPFTVARKALADMIKFTNANVTYPNGVSAMKDLNLEIEDGEFVVICLLYTAPSPRDRG